MTQIATKFFSVEMFKNMGSHVWYSRFTVQKCLKRWILMRGTEVWSHKHQHQHSIHESAQNPLWKSWAQNCLVSNFYFCLLFSSAQHDADNSETSFFHMASQVFPFVTNLICRGLFLTNLCLPYSSVLITQRGADTVKLHFFWVACQIFLS